MDGYRIVFSTLRSREYDGKYLYEWLMEKAKLIDIEGVTVINASEGYGRDKNIHSANFFELAGQPIEIIMLTSEDKCEKLFDLISKAGISILYSKTKTEFGFTK